MNRSSSAGIFTMLAIISGACVCKSTAADYPAARRTDYTDTYFGNVVADPYRWMEDIDSPETRSWVAAERSYTSSALDGMPERQALKARLTKLWNFPKFGLPEKRGARLFYTKNDGLQNQAILYAIDGPAGSPRVLIDPNTLSADGTVAMVDLSPSDDGALMGYGLAVGGSDWRDLHVRDVATGKDLPDVIHWAKFTRISWTHDGAGFFYGRFPEVPKGAKLFDRLGGRQLYYHRLGTDQSADRMVFEMKDHPEWFLGGETSDDGRYYVITVNPTGTTNNGIFYMDLGDPQAPRLDGPIVRLLDRFDAAYAFLGSSGPVFHVQTTLGSPKWRIVSIDTRTPLPSAWKTAVPEGEDSMEEVVFAGGKFVVATLHEVQSRLAVFGQDGASLGQIELPGVGAVSGISGTSSDPEIFYRFSSFLTPPSIFSRDLSTGTQSVFQSPQTAFDPSKYETKEIFYASKDGTSIPLFITGKKGFKNDGSSPAWLYAYGGFNISITPAYAVAPAIWIEMGGIYVQANIRGGGEFGEAWHLAGTKERKQNVFDDFIGAADFIIAKGYTSRDRLMIEGRSNGGLLIGAVLNQRPNLCAVAIPSVGVMDMLRFQKFTGGIHWTGDYGSSDDPTGFAYLRAYSPVHTVKAGAHYPPTLITTGDHDDRVFPAHSFKYAAEMQHSAGGGPILVRIDSNAGHGGSSGSSPVSKTIDEWADVLGFTYHYMPKGTLELPAGD